MRLKRGNYPPGKIQGFSKAVAETRNRGEINHLINSLSQELIIVFCTNMPNGKWTYGPQFSDPTHPHLLGVV